MLGDHPAIGVAANGDRVAIEKVWHPCCHGRMEGNGLFDDGKALGRRLDAGGVLCIVLRGIARHREAHRTIVNAHLVPYLAAQQPVYRQPARLAGDVPQGHLDGAHGATPGLEGTHLANAQHRALDLGRVGANEKITIEQHVWLEVGFVGFDLAIAVDPFVRDDPNDGILTDHGALEVGDLHARSFRDASSGLEHILGSSPPGVEGAA